MSKHIPVEAGNVYYNTHFDEEEYLIVIDQHDKLQQKHPWPSWNCLNLHHNNIKPYFTMFLQEDCVLIYSPRLKNEKL